ncbi:MAG: VCBS repeat-containing protein [Planctomycetales bacterium]|nr:VCBS repeat-containing protein [Planctomycetales bacterium]
MIIVPFILASQRLARPFISCLLQIEAKIRDIIKSQRFVRPLLHCLIVVVCCLGCAEPKHPPDDVSMFVEQLRAPATDSASDSRPNQSAELEADIESSLADIVPTEIRSFCGDCHALPRPASFERDVWYEEIRKGYEFYARSGRQDLKPPALEQVLRFYREHAPAKISFPSVAEVDAVWASKFEVNKLDWQDAGYITPAVSSISWLELMEAGKRHLVVCDMRDGSISLVDPDPQATTRNVLARVRNPARVAMVDFDKDGYRDLIVSDLGSFEPFDHQLGQVVLLKRVPGSDQFKPIVLLNHLGRVADCAAADFRGDNQIDLVVAEFGHRRVGCIRLLTNRTARTEIGTGETVTPPAAGFSFEQELLDIRPGAIRLPVEDWNADGQLDFAAVTSQEYESVDLFINRGDKFETHNLSLGADLTFGSVGIELVDLDQDGDQDILQVNGDCFDNNYASLLHGISWHENLGNLEFITHRIADLPGAYRALADDIDADGDLDIVAVANLPTMVKPLSLRNSNPVAILLLEQQDNAPAGLQFVPRVLQRGTARYAALEVSDFDGNGKVDFAVGAQLFETDEAGSPASKLPRLTIWWQK